ncbi:MAG TPA: tetratricopeptide repeat protein [Gammaproteobacteria bacterium]
MARAPSRTRRPGALAPRAACTAALLLGATASVYAQASASGDTFRDAEARFAAGDYRGALELFETARAAGNDGPAIHYNIGVCQYRIGEYAAAAATFRLLGERFPEMRDIADYNLGLALLAQGREAEAAEAFARAAASRDRVLAGLANQALERAGGEPERRRVWTRFVELQVGRDDNVALLDETSLPAGLSSESPFTELFGFASGEPFERAPLAFDVSGYAVRYPDAGEFDQDGLRLGTRYRWLAGDWQLEAGPYFDRSRLDGEGFEELWGVALRLTRPLGPAGRLDLRFERDEFDELDPQFAYVAGSRSRMRIRLDRGITRGRWRLSYELERNDREGPQVSADRDRLALDYEHYVNADWSVELGVSYRKSRYELRERKEDLAEASAGVLRYFADGWMASGELRWADNDATIEALAYDRVRVGVGISKLF